MALPPGEDPKRKSPYQTRACLLTAHPSPLTWRATCPAIAVWGRFGKAPFAMLRALTKMPLCHGPTVRCVFSALQMGKPVFCRALVSAPWKTQREIVVCDQCFEPLPRGATSLCSGYRWPLQVGNSPCLSLNPRTSPALLQAEFISSFPP